MTLNFDPPKWKLVRWLPWPGERSY